MAKRLAKKISIITGAANGIGFATTKKFLSEGSKVMMVDLNKDALFKAKQELLLKSNANKILTMHGDVSDINFAEIVMDSVSKNFGTSATVLVNNAGIVDMVGVLKMTNQQFKRVVDVNLNGTFLFTQAFLKQFTGNFSDKTNEDTGFANIGSIVNVTSLAGKIGMYHNANYAAAKSGVIGFTKTVCVEMGRYGIRCNAILPGFVETTMLEPARSSYLEKVKLLNPSKRFGTVDEIANACIFLASEESSYINGACLEVTGGLGA